MLLSRRATRWVAPASFALACLSGCVSGPDRPVAAKGQPAPGADEAAIRDYLRKNETGTAFVRAAPDLDWENAFGIRYHDKAKMDAFYGQFVAPLQAGDTGGTLEVRVRFLGPAIAVADEYWHEVGQRDMDTLQRGPDRWGRTTYIFEKADGKWVERIERVADLRLAYYQHFDALPAPAPLSPAALGALEGTFRFHRSILTLARAGDRFTVTRRLIAKPAARETLVGIPIAATTVLIFDPGDLAEYSRLDFSAGIPTATRSGDDPAVPGVRGTRESP